MRIPSPEDASFYHLVDHLRVQSVTTLFMYVRLSTSLLSYKVGYESDVPANVHDGTKKTTQAPVNVLVSSPILIREQRHLPTKLLELRKFSSLETSDFPFFETHFLHTSSVVGFAMHVAKKRDT